MIDLKKNCIDVKNKLEIKNSAAVKQIGISNTT